MDIQDANVTPILGSVADQVCGAAFRQLISGTWAHSERQVGIVKIAVAGGTGLTGCLVKRLLSEGHEVVILARRKGVDLVTGKGLADALVGVHVRSTSAP